MHHTGTHEGDSGTALALKALTDDVSEKVKNENDLYSDKGLHQWLMGSENKSNLLPWGTF